MTAIDRDHYKELEDRIQGALGSQVSVVCTRTDADPTFLWPQERKTIDNAVKLRQKEYAAGRIAARRAMRYLGWPESAIPTRKDRSPVWPDGLVGSITHTNQVCVVVISRKKECASLGIDIEPDFAVDISLWTSIFTDRELRRIWQTESNTQSPLATKVFTAKEAFYKWQFPTTGAILDFQDVEVCLNSSDRFGITPVSDRAKSLLYCIPDGQWVNSNGFTFASVGHRPVGQVVRQ